MTAMYFSVHQYPSLAHRPKAERYAIARAALKETGKGYALRFFFALVATVIVLVLTVKELPIMAPVTDWLADWRLWVGIAAGFAILYGWVLWEINGPIHRAVEKYLAARKG